MIEDASNSLKQVLDSLKGNPSCMAAMLLAVVFSILTYWSLSAERRNMQERQMKLIDRCTIQMR